MGTGHAAGARMEARQNALNETIAEMARLGPPEVPVGMDVAELRRIWGELTRDEQRALLQAAIQCVFVRPSRYGPSLDDRLHIVWVGERLELPARGARGFVPTRFVFPGN